ncbi:malonyl CoA-acyl carrier protein transacylase [Flammeovirgaceae bacterium 311]|nr:malonyl CoA-acyl carrier protein transacylase [Flammeovirgaceae bacterium 311]
MKAYIFPGQGAQFTGMGKDLYDASEKARTLFGQANSILGFNISDIMFSGSADDLKQTRVTQPAIFIHSVILARLLDNFRPDMVAGHSLGEFSALVAAGAITFEDGLALVYKRAMAMQAACEAEPSSMAAVLGLDDRAVEEACAAVQGEVVVAANYNCPGQLVISGSQEGVARAGELLKERGAKRVLPLQVRGAFHSPLMEPAREELQDAILKTNFKEPICPVYQNVDALPATNTATIKQNLISQLTAPVRWTQSVQNMVADGATEFIECGPGKVLQGLVKKIHSEATVSSAEAV